MSRARQVIADAGIAAGLAIGYVVALVRSVGDLGYARDEGFYFQAASSYGRWIEQLFTQRKLALEPRSVDAAWSLNHEHPGLIKSLFAISNLLLQQKRHLFAMEGTSYRFPAMVLAGLLIALVYVWGKQARGRVAGVSAAVLLAAMPRLFFHAHLACFDVPIIAMWTLTAYAYWRSVRDGGALWPLLTGIAFGLALDTKHNSWFLPFLVVAHVSTLEIRALLLPRLGVAIDAGAHRIARRRALLAFGAMAIVGPLVLYALWPWIWHDTVRRLRDYAAFHLLHEYYNMEFLGRNYWQPPMPRAYAPVMTLATVPGITLALFVAGLAVRARAWIARPRAGTLPWRLGPGDPAATDLLWLGALIVNYAAWTRATTPIFGGTKHWMTAYPFLALFAGVGVDAAARAVMREMYRLRRRAGAIREAARRARWIAPAIVGAAAFAAPIAETAHAHPWGLSSYTPIVGGAPGGASLGLNRGFWGYTTGAVTGFLNAEAPRGASVYVHDTAGSSWDMLQRDGRLRRDLRATNAIVGTDLALHHNELHFLGMEYQAFIAYGTARPAHIGGLDGVPVVIVYERPGIGKR